MADQNLYKLLRKYWGFNKFRSLQEEVIQAVMTGKDVLAILPTGGGKSLCYQLPALAKEGLTLVVSPLIALMNDQVAALQKKGIAAAAVHSQMPWSQVQSQLNRAHHGQLDLLYVSPERLVSERFTLQIGGTNVNRMVIDEAHCVSMWGYDFRPSYLDLAQIRELFPELQFMATTATATPAVLADIKEKLGLQEPELFQAPIQRDNIRFGVLAPEDKLAQLERLLRQVPGPAIIYSSSRRGTHEIAEHLRNMGINATAYHAGLDPKDRLRREKDFLKGDRQVMVATNAFGMGVDKADVRLVVHYEVPGNLEAYYQEAGRAGRDGQISYAVALHAEADLEKLEHQLVKEFPSEKGIRRVYDALGNYYKLALGSGLERSFPFDRGAFCRRYKLPVKETRHALQILEHAEWLALSDAGRDANKVHFLLQPQEIYDYRVAHPDHDAVVSALLRLHEGILFHPTEIDEYQLASVLQISTEAVVAKLKAIAQRGVIEFEHDDGTPRITFLRERVAARNLTIDREWYNFRKKRKMNALKTMREYLAVDYCRQLFIARYFGEDKAEPCGACDVCRGKSKKKAFKHNEYSKAILATLARRSHSLDEILADFDPDHHQRILDLLQLMVNEAYIIKKEQILSLA